MTSDVNLVSCRVCAGAGRRQPGGAFGVLARKEAWVCPACEGTGKVPLPIVQVEGKTFKALEGHFDCSCCGGTAHYKGDPAQPVPGLKDTYDYAWYVFRAGLSDSDGEYYARLCGDEQGLGGCLEAVAAQQDEVPRDIQEAIAIARELMPGEEDDGVISTIQDYIEGYR